MRQVTYLVPETVPQSPLLKTMLLVERVHMSFETWFIRQFQLGLIDNTVKFSLLDMRQEYIALCWKEELLWKEWCHAEDNKSSV